MAGLSIREAVKHFDVSRPTLANALKTGKVTGVKDGQGAWSIDPAELARVYHARSAPEPSEPGNPDNPARLSPAEMSTVDTLLAGQLEALRESLTEAEKRAAENERRAIESEHRAAVAEALAEERKRILDETLKLIPPPAPLPTAPVPAPDPASSLTSPRGRWWPWRRG